MVDKNTVTTALTLVSTDSALVRLVSLECREMALSLQTTDHLPTLAEESPLLLDLDSPGVAESLMMHETVVAAGICRDATALPAELTAKLSHLLLRPFATRRLRGLLSEICGYAAGFSEESSDYEGRPLINVGELSFVMESDTELILGGHTIRLSPTEGSMMRLLIENRGQTVSKEQLQTCLIHTDANETNKLEVYICFLRRKIERPTGLRLITTVRGKGYRLE